MSSLLKAFPNPDLHPWQFIWYIISSVPKRNTIQISFTTEKGKVNTYSTKFRLITMDKVFTPTSEANKNSSGGADSPLGHSQQFCKERQKGMKDWREVWSMLALMHATFLSRSDVGEWGCCKPWIYLQPGVDRGDKKANGNRIALIGSYRIWLAKVWVEESW